jgi:hypothetical protein
MTYNTLLDAYFSSYLISIGTPLLLIPLYYALRFKIRKGKEYTFGEACLVMGFAFVVIMIAGLMNPIYWGYGSPEAVREIRYANGMLLVIDHIRTMGSETDEGTPCSRVHVIDPKTGEKKLRFTLGEEADIAGIHGDTLMVLSYTDPIAYSITDGSVLFEYTDENLAKLYPELSSGISNVMWGNSYSLMEITANNGKQYNLDFTTGHFYYAEGNREPEVEYKPTHKLFFTDSEIKRDDEQWGTTICSLEGKNGNQYEEFLTIQDSIPNPQLSFLSAAFVAINADTNYVIISAETLENKSFRLTCVSRNCRSVLWEIRQAQYNADYQFSDYIQPKIGFSAEQNALTFWIEKTVYSVDASTGKLLWQTGL